jgi:hypothetical protein
MKTILSLLMACIINVLQAQIFFSPSYSFNYQHRLSDLPLENEKPYALAIGYDFKQNFGFGFQYQNVELWRFNEKIEKVIAMRSFSLHFHLHQSVREKPKWFWSPMVGVFAGLGERYDFRENSGQPTKMVVADQTEILKNPYFAGFLFQVNVGRTISENLQVAFFVRTEGALGIIGNRPWGVQSNASTTAMFTTGLRFSILHGKS